MTPSDVVLQLRPDPSPLAPPLQDRPLLAPDKRHAHKAAAHHLRLGGALDREQAPVAARRHGRRRPAQLPQYPAGASTFLLTASLPRPRGPNLDALLPFATAHSSSSATARSSTSRRSAARRSARRTRARRRARSSTGSSRSRSASAASRPARASARTSATCPAS